jgi:hypothetical protein
MKPVPAALAVLFVVRSGHPCTPGTLRQWVRRGHIRRTDDGYDLASIAEWLDTRSTGV